MILPVVVKQTGAIFVRDHLCGLVVRVSGYRSRGPGFYSQRVERGPHSLVRTTEELLEGKVATPI
jgi:hypothetical protein